MYVTLEVHVALSNFTCSCVWHSKRAYLDALHWRFETIHEKQGCGDVISTPR